MPSAPDHDNPSPRAETWFVAHIGQSLAEGGVGGDVVAELERLDARGDLQMPQYGPVGIQTKPVGAKLAPLKERARVTIGTSLLRQLQPAPQAGIDIVFHGQAWGGKPYEELRFGGATGVSEAVIRQAELLTPGRAGAAYVAITCIHGEQDGISGNRRYASDLADWYAELSSKLKAATGQTAEIPFLFCQTSSGSGYGFCGGVDVDVFPVPQLQLEAHLQNKTMHLVCPKYFLTYYDHSHITNQAQLLLGAYYGKALAALRAEGKWEPLRPSRIFGRGRDVFVTFAGRVGPLQVDVDTVKAVANLGFDYRDDAGNGIDRVTIVGRSLVHVRLSASMAKGAMLAYAFNNGTYGAGNQKAGLGSRGNLRDSDPTVSVVTGEPLWNWCVSFRMPITHGSFWRWVACKLRSGIESWAPHGQIGRLRTDPRPEGPLP